MVAETATFRRVDIELKSLLLMLGDLPDVAEEWEQLPDAEQASWSLDWDQAMGGLKVILVDRHTSIDELRVASGRE